MITTSRTGSGWPDCVGGKALMLVAIGLRGADLRCAGDGPMLVASSWTGARLWEGIFSC